MSESLPRFANLDEYVKKQGGTRALKKILLANNGIAAVKCIRSVRRWCYETFSNEREIEFVAMATPEDLKANAEYIRMADRFVEVPAGSNVNNYANVSLICQLAERYQVDGVWAGWGHASENPNLPKTLMELGIVFIGPPAGPMYALGDKIGSTIIAQSANVPTIAWNGQELRVDYDKTQCIPQDVYDQANVTTVEDCIAQVEKVGLPVMIKASEGGGGKGIRMVREKDAVAASFRQVQSEVLGSPIFVMKLAPRSRHLEVQLLADNYGNAIALNGRDCSVQRRHQKILEEGPPVAAPPEVWIEMERAAVRLAKAVGYINAGTVEYLFTEDGKFFFLELNPRLQVEHPVTEMITRTNLPSLQVNVAMGLRLDCIPDIRRLYEEDPNEKTPINFDTKPMIKPLGHVIASRITAENPFDGFTPTSGRIQELNFRSSRDVWGYFSVDSSGNVHEFADSQFGHLFSWGKTREVARRNLVLALKDLSIRGDIRTTVEYLNDMIESEDYKNNNIDTSWLDGRIKKKVKPLSMDPLSVSIIGAACQTFVEFNKNKEEFVHMLTKGRMPPKELMARSTAIELILDGVKYLMNVKMSGETSLEVECNDTTVSVRVRTLADGGFLVMVGGKSNLAYIRQEVGGLRLELNSHTYVFAEEYDPTKLRAKMGGKLLRYLVQNNARIERNQPFAEIEVMKMNMQVLTQETGTIKLLKPEGSVMEPGDIMCSMEIEDETKIKQARVFEGKMPEDLSNWAEFVDFLPHLNLDVAKSTLQNALDGYLVSPERTKAALAQLTEVVKNPMLPVLAIEEILARVKNALPFKIYRKLVSLGNNLRQTILQEVSPDAMETKLQFSDTVVGLNNLSPIILEQTANNEPLLQKLLSHSETYCKQVGQFLDSEMSVDTAKVLRGSAEFNTLYNVSSKYRDGIKVYLVDILSEMISCYYQVERTYADMEMSDAAEKDDEMQELRREYQGKFEELFTLAMSHQQTNGRRVLVIDLLNCIEKLVRDEEEAQGTDDDFGNKVRNKCVSTLKLIATLNGSKTTEVALEGREMLLELQQKSFKQQVKELGAKLRSIHNGEKNLVKELVEQPAALLHFLIEIILNSKDQTLEKMAIEIYLKRVYANYAVDELETGLMSESQYARFFFHAGAQPRLSLMGSKVVQHGSFENLTSLLTEGPVDASSMGDKESSASVGLDLDGPSNTSQTSVTAKPPSTRPGRVNSMTDSMPTDTPIPANFSRTGLFVSFQSISDLVAQFDAKLKKMNPESTSPPVNVIHAVLRASSWPRPNNRAQVKIGDAQDEVSDGLSEFLKERQGSFIALGIRRITFAVFPEEGTQGKLVAGHGCGFYTFRSSGDFDEDKIVRNTETPLAFQLDLPRLANFNISLVPLGKKWKLSNSVNVYRAVPKKKPSKQGKNVLSGKRYFVRALIRQVKKMDVFENISVVDAYPGPEMVFNECLAAIEAVQKPSSFSTQNHIFLNMLGDEPLPPALVEKVIKSLTKRYAKRLRAAGVAEVELKFNAKLAADEELPMRIIACNPTGFSLELSRYIEAGDPSRPGMKSFFAVNDLSLSPEKENDDDDFVLKDYAGLHGLPLSTPYKIASVFDEKRARATRVGTAYAYDYPSLFTKALQVGWKQYAKAYNLRSDSIPDPSMVVLAEELVMEEEERNSKAVKAGFGLVVTKRAPGTNIIGMVAWRLKLVTPEFPEGRYVIVIANDITFKAGSFGTQEDELFFRASQLSRALGLPRLYIAANSGARIGLAEKLKASFQVKLKNEAEPERGFEYLYLSKELYAAYGPEGTNAVLGEFIAEEDHYKIVTIVGEEPDLGVENLRGSGRIAGETSRAYSETFTLTYVSGRTVGIGAYLVRLGQRTIQKGTNAPILLTGYNALNALMAREVYSSNLQLGGTKVMYNNGVSHLCVRNDLEGVQEMVNWLSYLPATRSSLVTQIRMLPDETVHREVEFSPMDLNLNSFDPRHLLTGATVDGKFLHGFCDRNSFTETLSGWAKTVIVGRARLGGLPLGIIVSETRTVEKTAPADPAAPDSEEQVVQQAGQVWYPDSAYKTAQAIADLNHEGLPLMIFANWRGFSGGQRDMFDEVLKFGSFIVDELVKYKQPVFVYIIPKGELRGGAWVVVDETINSETMEMYADDNARGNVLEPSGAASIKFRQPDVYSAMHRTDPKLIEYKKRLAELEINPVDNVNEIVIIESEIKEREQVLFPVYKQIASHFVDLHDRPGRMKEKGVIREIVPWKKSRSFFFNRLQRKLLEHDIYSKLESIVPDEYTLSSARNDIEKIVAGSDVDQMDDAAVSAFLSSAEGKAAVSELKESFQIQHTFKTLKEAAVKNKNVFVDGLKRLIQEMKQEGKTEEVSALLSQLKL